jgi:hypothetical protein
MWSLTHRYSVFRRLHALFCDAYLIADTQYVRWALALDHHRGHALRGWAAVAAGDRGPEYHEGTIIPESHSTWVRAEISSNQDARHC